MSRLTLLHKVQASAHAFWQERNEQERRMLAIGGVVVGLALFYGLLIAPALEGRAKLAKDLPQLRQDEARAKALGREASELAARPAIQAPRMSTDSVNASLAANGLKAQSLSLNGDFAKVELKGVAFAGVISWLDSLRRSGAAGVQESNVTSLATPGMVDASITLRQGAGGVAR